MREQTVVKEGGGWGGADDKKGESCLLYNTKKKAITVRIFLIYLYIIIINHIYMNDYTYSVIQPASDDSLTSV